MTQCQSQSQSQSEPPVNPNQVYVRSSQLTFDEFRTACFAYLERYQHHGVCKNSGNCQEKEEVHGDELGAHQYAKGWEWKDPLIQGVNGTACVSRCFDVAVPALDDVEGRVHDESLLDWDQSNDGEGLLEDESVDVQTEQVDRHAAQKRVVTVHQSIHWSPTWKVPVLWFHASFQTGQSLSLDQFIQFGIIHSSQTLPTSSLQQQEHDQGRDTAHPDVQHNTATLSDHDGLASFPPISYADHPRSSLTTFFLHPCQTAQFLASTLFSTVQRPSPLQYLESFISLCASAIEMRS